VSLIAKTGRRKKVETSIFTGEFNFEITPEGLLEALKEDPRVTSAEYKNGQFYVDSVEGKFSFKMLFKKGDLLKNN